MPQALGSPSASLAEGSSQEKRTLRRVIFASSLGTLFEWYDFYLYGSLAVFFSSLFFPPGNPTTQLLASLATFGAGFGVRPLGALVFGHIGDRIGRKYTFLITMATMGMATALVGLLPTYNQIGIWATVILVALRLLQGLALGGEYGGAATYVAEHAGDKRRGFFTSFIQTTASLGFFVSMGVIGTTRLLVGEAGFKTYGWRVPFLISFVLLAVSMYIRVKMKESPLFSKLKTEGKASKNPFKESFTNSFNLKYVLIALFGATAGQGVVWYTGQFYALTFLTTVLKIHWLPAYLIMSVALALGTPFFVVFGHLSDRIGRKRIMLLGCAIAAVAYVPIYMAMKHLTPTVALSPQHPAILLGELGAAGFAGLAGLILIQVLLVTMVYGPIAAFLVELFPTKIRYTSMSLPYHIGNGWFGGFLPLIATAVTTSAAAKATFGPNAIYAGLAYPIAICLITLVVGGLLIRETKDHTIDTTLTEDTGDRPFSWAMPVVALVVSYLALVALRREGTTLGPVEFYLYLFFAAVFLFVLPVILFQFRQSGPKSLAVVALVAATVGGISWFLSPILASAGGLAAFFASGVIALIYAGLLLGVYRMLPSRQR